MLAFSSKVCANLSLSIVAIDTVEFEPLRARASNITESNMAFPCEDVENIYK